MAFLQIVLRILLEVAFLHEYRYKQVLLCHVFEKLRQTHMRVPPS